MYKTTINPPNWIRDTAGSYPDPLSHETIFYQSKIYKMHTLWPVTFVSNLTLYLSTICISYYSINALKCSILLCEYPGWTLWLSYYGQFGLIFLKKLYYTWLWGKMYTRFATHWRIDVIALVDALVDARAWNISSGKEPRGRLRAIDFF